MLRSTPIELRLALVIGMGQMGTQVVERFRLLLDQRLGTTPIVGLITLAPDYESDSGQLVHYSQDGVEHLRLPCDPVQVAGDDGTRVDGTATRCIGPQALRPYVLELQGFVDDIQGGIRTQDRLAQVREKLEGRGQIEESILDVFIVAALDEPFASGTFVDLAYLVDNILYEIRTDRFDYNTTGVLFLPNYAHDAPQGIREADTYAALKELDYYTSRCHYESDYGPRVHFVTNRPPFNSSCYLVETSNEEERKIPKPAHIAGMVSEWLFQCLTSPLGRYLSVRGRDLARHTASGRITAYSGMGVSSFILPIDAAIEECSVRLGKEMLARFRQEVTSREKAEPMRAAQAFRGELISRTVGQAFLRVEQGDDFQRFQGVPAAYFQNVDLWDFEGLHQRLWNLFGHRIKQTLPSLRREMIKYLEDALTEGRGMLSARVEQIINESPIAGVDRAYVFLETLRRDMADQARQARWAAKESHDREQTTNERIGLAGARYRAAGSTIDNWPARLWLVVSLVVIMSLLVYGETILWRRLPNLSLSILGRQLLDLRGANLVSGALLLLGHVVLLVMVTLYTYSWMRASKHLLIGQCRERLGHSLERTRHDLRRQFFEAMEKAVQAQLAVVTDFRDLLDDVNDRLTAMHVPPDLLYGKPRFPLEESVLTPQDLNDFYEEISKVYKKEGLDYLVARLIREQEDQGRRFYDWRALDPEDLADTIVTFGQGQMEPLRRWKSAEWLLIEHLEVPVPEVQRLDALASLAAAKLVETESEEPLLPTIPALTGDEQEALRRRVDELVSRARPFLRYNSVELPVDVVPKLVALMGVASAGAEQTPVNQVVKQHFSSVSLVPTQDPHAIVAMTARHGLPLYALGMARRYRTRYYRFFKDKPLHTRESYQTLPDLFPLREDLMEPQMALSLGLAVEIEDSAGIRRRIVEQDESGEYTYAYQDRRELVRVPLGADKIDVCLFLTQRTQSDHLMRISEQIDEAVMSLARVHGNEAVIQLLEDYLKEVYDALEDWEVASIAQYIGLLQ